MKRSVIRRLVLLSLVFPVTGHCQNFEIDDAFPEMSAWWNTEVDQGDGEKEYLSAMKYYHGRDERRDYANVLRWLRLSVEKGNAATEYATGFMFRRELK